MHHHNMEHCSCHPCTTRHFLTKEEKLEHLRMYEEHLKNELKGLKEEIARMS